MKATKTTTKTKANAYQAVTLKVIEQLKKGVLPWEKEWVGGVMPRNLFNSKKVYRGINVFLLGMLGYEKPFYLTRKQVAKLGGKIKTGEKPHTVYFYVRIKVKDKVTKKEKFVPVIREYFVYNVAQVEGEKIEQRIKTREAKINLQLKDNNPIKECEKIVKGYKTMPKIKVGEPAYFPSADYITMPTIKQFDSSESYYKTLFHEMTHSTGHKSRLKRAGIINFDSFGSDQYAEEELVAELGAMFLGTVAGIQCEHQEKRSASYIKGWVKRFQEDEKLIFKASNKAQQAADFILNKVQVKQPKKPRAKAVAPAAPKTSGKAVKA